MSLTVPNEPDAPAVLTIDRGAGGQPRLRSQLTLDRQTGEITKAEDFGSGSPGRKARSVLRFAHTGEVAGVVGQTVAGLASLGTAVLVWTGLALALRRLWAWTKRRSRPEESVPEERPEL